MLNCRLCNAPLNHTFVDLGCSPVANDYLPPSKLHEMEPFYPLHVYVCSQCMLVQIPAVCSPQRLFSDEYAYFSSYSDTWLAHAKAYADDMCMRFSIDADKRVIEVASNDGYLLRFFKARDVDVLGIEPAANCAAAAEAQGIPTLTKFFGETTAQEVLKTGAADLMVANNVLAHVPDINDFAEGFRILLKPNGIATFEFPHLLNLIIHNEFDTIYHEHYSYLSLFSMEKLFAAHEMTVFDVEEIPTHGGSLRLFVQHANKGEHPVSERVTALRQKEQQAGLHTLEGYTGFEEKVRNVKRSLLKFLIGAHEAGKTVAGYGAPAKGNTLLNYCGVRTDLMAFTVDRNPHKQGRFLPGTRIPIYAPEHILSKRPDYVLILPWNLKHEIMTKMSDIRLWGGQFVVPIPELSVL